LNKRLKLLLIEDSEDDASLLLRELQRAGYQVEFERVETADEVQSALSHQNWDLIICDYSLPKLNAPRALSLLQAGGYDLPFIIVSGTIGEETAVEALIAGAHDFVIKGSLSRLVPAVQRELKDAETRRKQREADEALRESIARFHSLFENTPVSIWEEDFSQVKIYLDDLMSRDDPMDLQTYIAEHPLVVMECMSLVKVMDVNQASLKMFGAKSKEELLKSIEVTFDKDAVSTFKQELIAISNGVTQMEMDVVIKSLDGQRRDATLNWAVAPGHETTFSRVLISLVDITDRKRRERELEAIASISQALRTVKSLNELCNRLLDESINLVRAESGSIWLYDSSAGATSLEAHKSLRSEVTTPLRQGQGIAEIVIRNGSVIVSKEFCSDPSIDKAHRGGIPKEVGGVCIPLHASESVIGAMFINVRLPRELTTDEVHLLHTLSEIGANAIHRTRLLEQSLKQINRLSSLRMIDLAISNSLDMRVSINTVLEQVLSQLNVDAACVLLMQADTGRLEYYEGRGFRTPAIASTSLRPGEGLAGQVVLDKKIIHVDDLKVENAGFIRRDLLADEEFTAYFGVPLIAKGEAKGVLEIFHRSPLRVDMEWLNFLDSLGWQTAIAVDNALLFENIQRSNFDLEMAYNATIEGWSRALDLRDKETEGHTQRVTEMTVKLARRVGIGDRQIVNMRRGALLHDIGKMGVPDTILLKPGPLTAEEWDIMRKHPQLAFDLLSPIAYLQPALEIPLCHHEKWDGMGYPRGLQGEQIPLAARIFAVADVWDALTSDRPYRPAWSPEKAIEFIRENSGTHFDPQVVEIFLKEMTKSE
jgi:response regulator RpfG family c-di-GMP phosphodiesterase/putative methionine-R-sulfoxide reductase with GAF domain